ncbi:adenylosuccinate lyase [Sporolactobacillus sp. STSJ-5]|uniref:adenylosuccinate lyase n=1 Tax=Sporolactobacillus sp. STSJ-5 TaxID=2965076 RepID=UPI0021066FA7|nr:adenylosuccinate lyase [Sporolactobacillus sp. STSJ-5]MCQ2009580.1 adenylosuccinate lyase [Sporolactobacillus sp. STSJ-5]
MGAHIIDNRMVGGSFGTTEMRQVWDEKNRFQKHLDVEAALAYAEGEVGLIPEKAAKAIEAHADADHYDLDAIAARVAELQHTLMPTIEALQHQSGDYGEFVHYGATTQDIVDTGTVLQLKEAFTIVERDTKAVALLLRGLAEKYRNTLMTGRTHGVQALPITFGFKCAIWLDELLRHLDRLKEIKARVLTGNISGAVGTYASFDGKGPEIEKLALEKLDLNVPNICWQSSRDRFSEYASVIALISGTLGKIGNEFYLLMHTEIDEIEEPFTAGKVGSSTMPHKRNPSSCEGLASLTQPVLHAAALIHQSLTMEHERDAMSWRAEWIALPELNIYLSAQLQLAQGILKGLTVRKDNMLKNLKLQHGLILSEKVMFELGKEVGKQTAHHLVYTCAMTAFEQERPFEDVLWEEAEIRSRFSKEEIDHWLDPAHYLGSTQTAINRVLQRADTVLGRPVQQ